MSLNPQAAIYISRAMPQNRGSKLMQGLRACLARAYTGCVPPKKNLAYTTYVLYIFM
jgi:hypothetical protein